MPSKLVEDVAIIGAGLGGTVLAIALHRQGIACRIYELRGAGANPLASGVSLHVNGCRALDALGVLGGLRDRAFKIRSWTYFDDASDQVTKYVETGSERRYGYANHRLYRAVLLEELRRAVVDDCGIAIQYDARFEGVVDETADSVSFKINGRVERASMLIGADGAWSAVRRHISPTAVPEYTGMLVAFAHVPAASVRWPEERPAGSLTVQGRPGSLFTVAEVADGSEMLVGRQFEHPELSREQFDALGADKQAVLGLFRAGYDDWRTGGTGRSLVDAACARPETASIWPYRRLPPLDSWSSPRGRVVLIGDAAHVIPPSSGQGVNQAIEDAYALSLLLGAAPPQKIDLPRLLRFWKDWRQARLDDIVLNMAVTDASRLPADERARQQRDGRLAHLPTDPKDIEALLRRIYTPETERDMAAWIEANS